MSSYLKNFALPGVVLMVMLAVSARRPDLWTTYGDLLQVLPYILFATCAAVALYLLQYAYLYTAVLFGSAYVLIQLHMQTALENPVAFSAFLYLILVFPLLLMAVVLQGRKALLSFAAILLLFFISSFYWLPFLFVFIDIGEFISFAPAVFHTSLFSGTWFSVGMLLTVVPVFIFLMLLYALNPTLLQAHWIYGLVLLVLVLMFFSVPHISSLSLSAFSLLLLVALFQEAFQLAYVDELTGIPGRKALQKQMLNLGRRYSIAMLDVDHFKKFNDTYGHDVGDQVLRMVAAQINQVGGGGKAYRYGGEEFTILFPGKHVVQVVPHLEALRESIAQYSLLMREETRPEDDKLGKKQRRGRDGKRVSVTISIGVAEKKNSSDLPEDIIKKSDKALYSAKKNGRDCVASVRR